MDVASIKSSMGQQVRLLNQIDELVTHCQQNSLIGDVAKEDMRALADYVGNMRKACDVVNLLADKTQDSKDKLKTAKKPREKKPPVPETDELDFLD